MADKVEKCPNCEAERKRRVEAEASVEQLGGDLKAAQMDYANEHRLREAAEANCRNLESALEEARKEARMWEERAKELESAANVLVAYCEDHNWGTMPEPFASINPLLKLLRRES